MCEPISWMRTKCRTIPASCLILLTVICLGTGKSGFTPETSWKKYRNKQWGYCVSYPTHWLKGEAFEGSGIFVKAGLKKHSRAVGEIDIGAISEKATDAGQPARVSLTDNFELHVEGLKRFERAEHLEILEKRPTKLFGHPALFTKDRYFDPQDGLNWVDEIVLAERNSTVYRLELECRSDQLDRFEPVFTHLVSTFQIDCKQ